MDFGIGALGQLLVVREHRSRTHIIGTSRESHSSLGTEEHFTVPAAECGMEGLGIPVFSPTPAPLPMTPTTGPQPAVIPREFPRGLPSSMPKPLFPSQATAPFRFNFARWSIRRRFSPTRSGLRVRFLSAP